jgi:hypothetical protein
MQGYASRTHGADGIHDRLSATALALDDGTCALALVTCDLIGLPREAIAAARRAVAEYGIDPQAVMFNCSHTHGGPTTGRRSYVKREDSYMAGLVGSLADAVNQAFGNLRDSKLSLANGAARIGVNRRALLEGRMVLGENPEGPIDPDLPVLRVATRRGRTLALLFSHACHCTTLGGDNYKITADYVGYARQGIESALSKGALSSYVSGASGNINPSPRGTFELAREHGSTLAAESLRVARRAKRIPSPELCHASVRVNLPLTPPPPVDELEADLVELESELRRLEGLGTPAEGIRAHVQWRHEMMGRVQKDAVRKNLSVEVQALGIGPLGIVGLPGEVFVEIGQAVKERSPFGITILSGYTNGNIGYIPTATAFEEGGYEPTSYVYTLQQEFDPKVEKVATSGALRALNRCRN